MVKKIFQPITLENLLDILQDLIQGRGLVVFPEHETAVELSYGVQDPVVHKRLSPTRLPFRDLQFDTVALYLPQEYPQDLKKDALSEVSRIAGKRILILGDFVPADEKKAYCMNAAFRLTEKVVIGELDGKATLATLSVFDF